MEPQRLLRIGDRVVVVPNAPEAIRVTGTVTNIRDDGFDLKVRPGYVAHLLWADLARIEPPPLARMRARRRRRWLLVLLVAAIVVAAVAFLPGLILSNLPWSTYSSNLGYEMAVPDSWVLTQDSGRDNWRFGDAKLVVARGSSPGASIADVTESQARDFATSQGMQFESLTTSTLDSAPARLIAMHVDSSTPGFAWYLLSVRGDTIWALLWSDDPVREATDKVSFEQIRSSFHVVNQVGTSSPGPT